LTQGGSSFEESIRHRGGLGRIVKPKGCECQSVEGTCSGRYRHGKAFVDLQIKSQLERGKNTGRKKEGGGMNGPLGSAMRKEAKSLGVSEGKIGERK